MSQKTEQESGRRVRRMLQLILLLQESQSRSLMELAEQFGVSRRTILRDVQLLRESGFPVAHDTKGGYELRLRLVRQMELDPLEMVALAGLESSQGMARFPFLRAAREVALAKLTAPGSPLTQAQVQHVRNRLNSLIDNGTEDLDEGTVEVLIENWIAEARKESAVASSNN
jgi:predicted DNA-binding transcriptional regulator YafY